MEVTKQRKFLSLKMNLLEEELSAVSNHVNKILQQGKAWIDGTDEDAEGRKLSYKEISSLIEDTAMLMAEKYADLTESNDHKDQVTKTSEADTAISSSQVTAEVIQTAAESEALKTAVAHIEKMEKELFKQKADIDSLKDHVHEEMNKKLDDVAQKVVKQEKTKKISKMEQKLEKIETQNAEMFKAVEQRLKNLEEERENAGNFEAIEQRLESLEEGETETVGKMEAFGQRLETVEGIETQSAEKLATMGKKVGSLEHNDRQTLEELRAVKEKMGQLETSSTCLSSKVENQEAFLQELTSNKETDDAKLRKVQSKLRVLEKEKNKSLAKVGKQFEDVEFQYKMVCNIVADRLVPLERLRGILNDRVKSSAENVQKLHTVVQDVAGLLPRVSQLESQAANPMFGTIGVTVQLANIKPRQGKKLFNWVCEAGNAGGHFDLNKGLFCAPLDGMYWVGLNTWQKTEGEIELYVSKILSGNNLDAEKDETLINTCSHKAFTGDCDFAVIDLKAGDKLYVIAKEVKDNPELALGRFSIFFIK